MSLYAYVSIKQFWGLSSVSRINYILLKRLHALFKRDNHGSSNKLRVNLTIYFRKPIELMFEILLEFRDAFQDLVQNKIFLKPLT